MSRMQRNEDNTGEHEADGSFLGYLDAGNSDPIGCVDSDVTVWLT